MKTFNQTFEQAMSLIDVVWPQVKDVKCWKVSFDSERTLLTCKIEIRDGDYVSKKELAEVERLLNEGDNK